MSFGECLFLPGLIKKDQSMGHMSVYIEDLRAMAIREQSRRHEKVNPLKVGPTWQQARAAALEARVPALVGPPVSFPFYVGAKPPLRINLLHWFK
jgi:hypothetical protein